MAFLSRSLGGRSPRNRTFIATTLFLSLLLAACVTVAETPPPSPATPDLAMVVSPTPTPTEIPSPTPTQPAEGPDILRVPLASYLSPDSAFTIQVPATWKPQDIGGGIRFQETEFGPTSVTAHYLPLPVTADPDAYVSDVISQTFSIVQYNNADNFMLLRDEVIDNGHRQVEFLGQLDPELPLAHVLAELWVESNTLLGLSLTSPVDEWANVQPLWDLLIANYEPRALETVRNNLGLNYVHPSRLFTVTVPVDWGIVDEFPEEGEVLFSDTSGFAQFSISATEMDHHPAPADLEEALGNLIGDVKDQEGYLELKNEEVTVYEQVRQFETLTEDNGFYRTELRAMSHGNMLVTTAFNAPPHDWEVFAPAYQLLLSSLQVAMDAPPDEATQDDDPTAGIKTGQPMFYLTPDENLWVSAAITNNRTRNLGAITAAIELYNENDKLLGAESWRLAQGVLGTGRTTYLTEKIGNDVAPVQNTSYVLIKIVDAKDTQKSAPRGWGYEGGKASINEKGNAILNVTMRNATNSIQRRIYLVGLLYDEDGELSFAKAETKRLPYAVPPGETVDLKLSIAGPHSGLTGFDVVGEVP